MLLAMIPTSLLQYSDDSDDLYGGRRQVRRRGWGGGRDVSQC